MHFNSELPWSKIGKEFLKITDEIIKYKGAQVRGLGVLVDGLLGVPVTKSRRR